MKLKYTKIHTYYCRVRFDEAFKTLKVAVVSKNMKEAQEKLTAMIAPWKLCEIYSVRNFELIEELSDEKPAD